MPNSFELLPNGVHRVLIADYERSSDDSNTPTETVRNASSIRAEMTSVVDKRSCISQLYPLLRDSDLTLDLALLVIEAGRMAVGNTSRAYTSASVAERDQQHLR
jgi:hypothetical protein